MTNPDIINRYYDMTLKEIADEFGKTPQAVSNGVTRMLERNPDHPEWKYKKGSKVMISGDGVEWLSNYFVRGAVEVFDEEKMRMQMEIDALKKALEKEENRYNQLFDAFNKATDAFQNKLLIENNTNQELKIENQNLKNEINSFEKSVFGFYKKKKTTQ